MGISKWSIFRQRAAGWCKAVGKPAEIPPGVAFLNKSSRERRGRPRQREALLDAVRPALRGAGKPEVVPRILRPLSARTGGFFVGKGEIDMLTTPMDILQNFPIRKTKKQKSAFRTSVTDYVQSLGYQVKEEKGSMGARNLVIGDPEQAKFLVTAHYDTPARMFFPNFITPLNFVAYLAYQIFAVGGFVFLAWAVGAVTMLLTQDSRFASLVGYLFYWVILVLLIAGPANKHNANDNTSGVVTVLEILRSLPEIHRSKVCFVLFDLEEAGLIGSASHRKTHKKATETQIVLNLDCVGDGDYLMMFPNKKIKADEGKMAALERICGQFGEKHLKLHKKGFSVCPSDHKNFPNGVGIMAFKHSKLLGIYCDKIHTNRDVNLELKNVNILRAALTTLICQ